MTQRGLGLRGVPDGRKPRCQLLQTVGPLVAHDDNAHFRELAEHPYVIDPPISASEYSDSYLTSHIVCPSPFVRMR